MLYTFHRFKKKILFFVGLELICNFVLENDRLFRVLNHFFTF